MVSKSQIVKLSITTILVIYDIKFWASKRPLASLHYVARSQIFKLVLHATKLYINFAS
jgi:hypothetical protein